MTTANVGSPELIAAIVELRTLFPEWRLGQMVANLAHGAGFDGPEGVWDAEDEHLLEAARRLIARNQGRRTATDPA